MPWTRAWVHPGYIGRAFEKTARKGNILKNEPFKKLLATDRLNNEHSSSRRCSSRRNEPLKK